MTKRRKKYRWLAARRKCAAALRPPVYEVRTAIEVNAPPKKVWNEVVAFAEIPPPKELLFRSGVACPIRAEITGHRVGAVRHCIFSTGPFVEPIEVWDEPHLLKFGVTASPALLNELTHVWTYRRAAPARRSKTSSC